MRLCVSCGGCRTHCDRDRYKGSAATPPTFAWAGVIAPTSTAAAARCAQPADFDLDGDLDVVVASQNDNHIAWYGVVVWRWGAAAASTRATAQSDFWHDLRCEMLPVQGQMTRARARGGRNCQPAL